jgi:hypothetical protein
VPKRCGDQVQLSAVLRPAYGHLRTEADIARATAWALHHWRRRAGQLAEAGCLPFAAEGKKSQLPNALACPVAFVMTYDKKLGRRPCKLTTICPFCWAREVRRHWLTIDAAFFPPPPGAKQRVRVVDTDDRPEKSTSFTRDIETAVKSPYDLIRRVFTFRVPAEHLVEKQTDLRFKGDRVVFKMPGILAWLRSRTQRWPFPCLHRLPECRALLKSAGPGGGLLEALHFRRVASNDEANPWEVQIRQLILAADGDNVLKKMPTMMSKGPRRHIVFRKPRRRLVVAAVARTLHYPDFLIDPQLPIEHVVEYLNFRRGQRLVASYGRFRASQA